MLSYGGSSSGLLDLLGAIDEGERLFYQGATEDANPHRRDGGLATRQPLFSSGTDKCPENEKSTKHRPATIVTSPQCAKGVVASHGPTAYERALLSVKAQQRNTPSRKSAASRPASSSPWLAIVTPNTMTVRSPHGMLPHVQDIGRRCPCEPRAADEQTLWTPLQCPPRKGTASEEAVMASDFPRNPALPGAAENVTPVAGVVGERTSTAVSRTECQKLLPLFSWKAHPFDSLCLHLR